MPKEDSIKLGVGETKAPTAPFVVELLGGRIGTCKVIENSKRYREEWRLGGSVAGFLGRYQGSSWLKTWRQRHSGQ
jgi:hypothetical protein